MKKQLVVVVAGLFAAMLLVSWLTHGTGVVKDDLKQNVYIPKELTMPLQVQAAYDGERMFFRYRWPARQPSIYHDMLVYRGGKWERVGNSTVGPQPQGIYEDRVTMLVDDGSVPEFEKYGGYITIGDRMRFFTGEATKAEVNAHPYLGKKKQNEVGKHLPGTRTNPGDWRSVVPEEQLAAQRQAGYFLDLWHWRAHRSNPIDKSDDQFVAEARYGDGGKGVFFTNWDGDKKQPKLMFDPAKAGTAALKWDDLARRKLGFDDLYYMREDQAKPFDPNHAWKEGDTIPRRVLRAGEGSRADISVVGKARWKDGYWDVTLMRAMDTGHPLDDKILRDQGRYTVAFAVHRDTNGSRWHYVSLPVSLGLARNADLTAVRFTGETPPWNQPWHEVKLFYPGQVSWPMLNSQRHAGADNIRKGVPVKFRHSEIQLANYGVEVEFNEAIRGQWGYTLFAGVLLIGGFGTAVNLLIPRRRN
ncbi:cytochrome C [Sulfurifustis variabilis]|uniref:Cytochrome C n=1 Tax=Sulfurifustis variabilis TaxID=1675686 RepID=A0A1B4V6V4_9GAMM|nr:ethylbenzene dehydrogenase-related protein [Sulfurifustis variabilis]BAU49263.1 cytochrome C [Sulfurifustis variabilis]